MFYNDIKQKMLLWMHENTWKLFWIVLCLNRCSVAWKPCTICTICTSASLLNRSAFQLRFHTFTDSPWLDSVVPFVPLNHEIISHKFKLCCLITTSVRSWEVNAQELLLLGDKSHHKIARSNWSRRCSFIVFNLLSLHCFKWPWLHQKVKGETIRRHVLQRDAARQYLFGWLCLHWLAFIFTHGQVHAHRLDSISGSAALAQNSHSVSAYTGISTNSTQVCESPYECSAR